jgi:hypothetical protein
MIHGFEDFTEELTEMEKDVLLPIIVTGLVRRFGKEMAVKNKDIIAGVLRRGYRTNEVRIRKIINYIRVKNLIPGLLASQKGYYVSEDPEEVSKYITSLKERNNQVERVIQKMKEYLETLKQ